MEGVLQKTSCSDEFIYDSCVRDVSHFLKDQSEETSTTLVGETGNDGI